MKILLFGATGQVGSRILSEALTRGHRVTAVLRSQGRSEGMPEAVQTVIGDARDAKTVQSLSDGKDLVISATRPQAGQKEGLVESARALLMGAADAGVRLLLVGGAGSLITPDRGVLLVDDPRYVGPGWRDIALACCRQLDVCHADSRADWSYLSPPAVLQPGLRTGNYRLGRDELLLDAAGHSTISLEDFAVALLDEAETPRHRRQRFTVAY